jgi:CRP/FNR family transcriptional regulator, anaerobic regulatory protein
MVMFRPMMVFREAETCPKANGSDRCAHCGVRKLSVCTALEVDEFCALEEILRPVSFEAKDSLFNQDEVSDCVYNITSGAVRLYKLLPDGRRQVIGFALPGDFLGLAMSERNAFSADALTTVNACQFARKDFSNLLDRKPHLLRRLHEIASHELTLAQDQMVILGRRTAEEKVVAFLLGLRDRLARIDSSTVHVPLPMTRQDIGDFLGLTVETVSRMFSKLAREKALVIVPDGVRLLDLKRLAAIAAT